ncbi:hypothetical protein SAZ11_47300 [Streptomyces sp. FXJ1.4098]|nr:hypothetical protein [Streptomyces sp. FXJ1.4098]
MVPLTLSARGPQALAEQARRLSETLADATTTDSASVAWSLATTRTTFDHRAVITGTDTPGLLARSTPWPPAPNTPTSPKHRPRPEQGPSSSSRARLQWRGMGVELLDTSPSSPPASPNANTP